MTMTWQQQLRKFEDQKQWDQAIEFMQRVIAENPHDIDAYLYMNYLLMNLLVEEEHGEGFEHDYYATLAKKYFDESYAKFSDNPEYLFYTGKTAFMSVWYFGIETDDAQAMLDEAMQLDPDNLLYQQSYYIALDFRSLDNQKKAIEYAKIIVNPNSSIKKMLLQKGSLGEYVLEILTYWCNKILAGGFPY